VPPTNDGYEEPADSEEPQDESVQKALEEGDDEDDVSAAGDDRDCSDFTSHQEAQNFFEGQGGTSQNNVDNLDADGDGLACEDPIGGIDSGGGGMAPRPSAESASGPVPFVLGGAAAGLLVALLGTSLRRRLTA
jgi:hypothetical protein